MSLITNSRKRLDYPIPPLRVGGRSAAHKVTVAAEIHLPALIDQAELRGAALEMQTADDEEILTAGPFGTGKSVGCLARIHFDALRYPASRQLIIRKTRVSLTDSGLVTFEEKVVGPGHPLTTNMQRKTRDRYRYPNGSEVVIGGMDKPDKVLSTEYDRIYVQEATELTENEWETLSGRLRNGRMPFQQMMADCNPSHPRHWLKLRADRKALRMLHSRHKDNPALWDGQNWTAFGAVYLAKLERMTGVRRKRFYLGLWAASEGAIYEFDPEIHLLDRFEIPASWQRYRTIDFGFVDPFVCQWWAVDYDKRLYLYREVYMSHTLVSDHAARIRGLSEGERISASISDHDAEGRATLKRGGIETIPAKKDIIDGIQLVQERLKVQGDGKPRLYVLRDSLVERDELLEDLGAPISTEQEFDSYEWAKTPEGRPNKEEPIDLHNHGMDAMRYMVMYLDATAPQESRTAMPRALQQQVNKGIPGLNHRPGGFRT